MYVSFHTDLWKDKRPVHIVTTRNHPVLKLVTNTFGKISEKTEEVAEYIAYMGGIN